MDFDSFLDEHEELAQQIAELLDDGSPYQALELLFNELTREKNDD